MSEFYNIQSASPQYVPYGSDSKVIMTKAMPESSTGHGTEQMIRGPMPSRKMSTDHPMPNGPHSRQRKMPSSQMPNDQMPNAQVLREGLEEDVSGTTTNTGTLHKLYNKLTTNPQYDMSDKILSYPQGHPLYAPQTLAEVRRTDSDAMLRSENMIFGIALASGISIIVLGFLMSSGKLSAPDMPTQM